MSDGAAVKRVMEEAHKLNMVEGNFVWLWIDTSATIKARNDSKLSIFFPPAEDITRIKDRRARGISNDSSDSYFDYIIKYFTEKRSENISSSDASNSEINNETSDKSEVVSKFSNDPVDLSNRNDVSSNADELNKTMIEPSTRDELYTLASAPSFNSTETDKNIKNTNYTKFKLVRHYAIYNNSDSLIKTFSNEYVWIGNLRKHRNEVSFLPTDRGVNYMFNPNTTPSSRKVPRSARSDGVPALPVGLLGIRAVPLRFDRQVVRSTVRLLVESMRRAVFRKCRLTDSAPVPRPPTCWLSTPEWRESFAKHLVQ